MEWFAAAGTGCTVASVLGAVACVAIFRSDSRREHGHPLALSGLVVLGAMSPVLLLAGVILIGYANSGPLR